MLRLTAYVLIISILFPYTYFSIYSLWLKIIITNNISTVALICTYIMTKFCELVCEVSKCNIYIFYFVFKFVCFASVYTFFDDSVTPKVELLYRITWLLVYLLKLWKRFIYKNNNLVGISFDVVARFVLACDLYDISMD